MTECKTIQSKIYDYYYDIEMDKFQLWSENLPTFSCPVHQGLPLNVFVHTASTMCIGTMIDNIMIGLEESIMIVGESGCGKTSLISDKLKTCTGDLSELFSITINTNRLTTSDYLQKRIGHHLTWSHGSHYLPKGNKRMYCFVDDLNQAQVSETSGRQTAVEFLRQHLDSEHVYDLDEMRWQHIKNITYICTFNHKLYTPTHSTSNKILKHFHVVAQHYPK